MVIFTRKSIAFQPFDLMRPKHLGKQPAPTEGESGNFCSI